MRLDELSGLRHGPDLTMLVSRAFERRGETAPETPRVDYVRWKSGTSCLLGIGSGGERRCDLGYIKIFEGDDAGVCVEKYQDRERGTGWVEHVPEWNAALFRFPLDRAVDGLALLSDMGKLKHVLHDAVEEWSPKTTRIRARKSTLQVIKYKPERRGLVRAEIALRNEADATASTRTIVAQAYADETGQAVHQVLSHLTRWNAERLGSAHETMSALRVPAPLGYDVSRRILIQEWCLGVEWGSLIGTPRFHEGCRAAALALIDLQGVAAPALVAAEPLWEGAARVLNDLAELNDTLFHDVVQALSRDLPALLAQATPSPVGLIHGDFHYHQLLLDREQHRATLIDWDEARIGDPREDPGNLLAHFHLLELEGRVSSEEGQRLREAFLSHLPPLPDISVFTALQLVKLAFVPFRNLRPDWRTDTATLLARAAEILATEEATS